jgi:hypothetical protein
MGRHGSTPEKIVRELSDAILATRYLDLQKLRDEVRKAEARFASNGLKGHRLQRRGPRPTRITVTGN